MKQLLVISAVLVTGFALAGEGKAKAEGAKKDAPEASRPAVIKKYDKDGDGKLNEAERDAMRKEAGANHVESMLKRDKDGDGSLTLAEFTGDRDPARMEKRFKTLDTNGDGKLDKAELAAMTAPRPEAKKEGDAKPKAKDGKKKEGAKE